MFERFTPEARQVIVQAQDEARALRHNYIGTEHILLGLMSERGGVVAQALASQGLTLERTRSDVTRIVGWGEEVTSSMIPFTPRAKKVLEISLQEAMILGHNAIGPEHILLGIVSEGQGVGARILVDSGADLDTIREEWVGAQRGSGPPRSELRLATGRHVPAGVAVWLEDLGPVLDRLEMELRRELDRPPDLGDLLLVLACAPETLAGRGLRELAIDVEALRGAIERARDEVLKASTELEREAGEARQAKERAIEAQDYETAAKFRDQEREFSQRKRGPKQVGPQVLREIRRQLGLPEPPEARESL